MITLDRDVVFQAKPTSTLDTRLVCRLIEIQIATEDYYPELGLTTWAQDSQAKMNFK